MTAHARLVPGPSLQGKRKMALGVLGGGQLGRMFTHAAQSVGFDVVVLDPDPTSPAGAAANHQVKAAYLDAAGLAEIAARCDAITTEFENVPAQALGWLAAARRPVSPSAAAVSVCQHRGREKAQFEASGVPCVPYAVLESEGDVAGLPDGLLPGILKSATLGYDGKGQVAVATRAGLASAWQSLGGVPCVLERQVDLLYELSVIVARNAAGDTVHLPVQQNLHRGGVLVCTQVPAPNVPPMVAAQAVAYAQSVARSLDYVGVLCVEFFLLRDGRLLANEMAPRPHNSGHYSIDACDLSQFDLQVRTTAGLPLVAPRLHSPAVMLNLMGDLWFPASASAVPVTPCWDVVLALPGAHLHLYGKTDARPGRKMGHLTVTAVDGDTALQVARQAAVALGIAAF
jgi:5-(carboxyamino)imidazole ribonucleotide synthase